MTRAFNLVCLPLVSVSGGGASSAALVAQDFDLHLMSDSTTTSQSPCLRNTS